MPKLTPMMQQYQEIKARYRDAILFFRLGDFYEMFNNDAIEASKILDITLTARSKKTNPIPMCGVPFHAAENYIARLTKAGRKVAICEQVSDAALPGIVKRDVVRVVTPGTTFNEQLLSQKNNRYILALFPKKDYFGFAFADLTTGEFQAAEAQGKAALELELLRLDPAEIILSQDHYDDPELRAQLAELTQAPISRAELYEEAPRFIKTHFKLSTLEGFGIANWPFALQSAAVLLKYLLETQKDALIHIDRIRAYHREYWMQLDEATIRNLELFSTLRDHDKEGTLLSVIDETETAFGGRLIRRWLLQPLLKRTEIEARHQAVEDLISNEDLRYEIQAQLKEMGDLERLLARLCAASGNARDLNGIAAVLNLIPRVQSTLEQAKSPMLQTLQNDLIPLDALTREIHSAIKEEPLMKLTEGGMIKQGYNDQLDELLNLIQNGKDALREIELKEKESTGISSLKVGFNKVFGYYIEVTKVHSAKVPAHYVRKQTLTNAERYITDELKKYEEKVLGAGEKAKELEYKLFMQVRAQVLENLSAIKQNAAVLAQLDALLSFAKTALHNNYVRPQFSEQSEFQIVAGRHPVVEQMSQERRFIPNDVHFESDVEEIKLITGPNMSGKSTYLRQVALIALMAQMGSFVPAESCTIRVLDRIFTRVGASDNLVRGQSTFMVEMQESAYILNHATDRSLVILDEVGRGTSTFDGMSIASAILEHLHDEVRPFTLFATHYHELIELADELERAQNYSVDVQETKTGVAFLHKIKEGGINKSYGIEVAKLAGMPLSVIERSQEILTDLESEKHLHKSSKDENQMDLFSSSFATQRSQAKLTHPALERLKSLDIDSLTPLEALNTLNELKAIKEKSTD